MSGTRRFVLGLDKLVSVFTALMMMLLLAYGGYALWDNYQIYNGSSVPDAISHYKPSEDNPSLAELQAINGDVRAWLTIDGTNIDYPVMQSKDNAEYLNSDIYKEFSLGGSIFMDYRNASEFTDFYSLLYGHHMDGGAMFGDLNLFIEADYFNSHQSGVLITSGKTYKLDIFACVTVDAYDPIMFETESQGKEILSYIQNHSANYRQISLGEGERLLAMSTCYSASTNGRTIVVARMTEQKNTGGDA